MKFIGQNSKKDHGADIGETAYCPRCFDGAIVSDAKGNLFCNKCACKIKVEQAT